MKPDWKDAPAWAKFLAMGVDGQWTWYEFEPNYKAAAGFWSCDDSSKFLPIDQSYNALTSLEERPNE